MSSTGIARSGLAAYMASALTGTGQQAATTGGSVKTVPSRATAAASRALETVAHSRKSVAAQSALGRQQAQLTSEIHAALAKAGLTLTGEVTFSEDAAGAGQVVGSQADRTTIASILKDDTSKPGLQQRLTALVQSAAKLSTAMRDSATWVQAARSAGRNGNVLDLYASLSQAQDTSATTYRIDGQSGALTYAGIVSSQA